MDISGTKSFYFLQVGGKKIYKTVVENGKKLDNVLKKLDNIHCCGDNSDKCEKGVIQQYYLK